MWQQIEPGHILIGHVLVGHPELGLETFSAAMLNYILICYHGLSLVALPAAMSSRILSYSD